MWNAENQMTFLFNRIRRVQSRFAIEKRTPAVKRDLFARRKKVAEKIAPFPRRTPAVKGRTITAGVHRVNPGASSE